MKKLGYVSLILLIGMSAFEIAIAEEGIVPSGTVYGHVYNAETKQPLPGAFVYCEAAECSKPLTKKDGYYAIERCFSADGSYKIHCSKYGYESTIVTAKTDDKGMGILDIYLKPAIYDNVPELTKPASDQGTISEKLAVLNLKSTWSISGIEAGTIVMMLDQDGQDLFGAAKYESEGGQPWNAMVVGSVEGDEVYLAITALKISEQVSSMLKGMLTDDGKSIAGNFFTLSEGKISSRGEFIATIAHDDISYYEPAKIGPYTEPTGMLSGVPIGLEGT